MSLTLLLNPLVPKIFNLLLPPTATARAPPPPPHPRRFSAAHKLYHHRIFTINPRITRRVSSSLISRSLHFSRQNGTVGGEEEEEEEPVIGDCLVFEEGIFDDPFLQEESSGSKTVQPKKRKNNSLPEVKPENLIPESWREMQREINITKKERRKLAYEMQFGRKLEKRREALRPIGSERMKNVNEAAFIKYRNEKMKQLKPFVLEDPVFSEDDEEGEKGDEDEAGSVSEISNERVSSTRVNPRNPRIAVYGGGLDDITEFFNSGIYDPNATKTSDGRQKLFTPEEKFLLNRRVPDLAALTSGKWHPLHTLAACGDFYLMTALLKHNVDINASDQDGLSAIHKAIIGNKQAIFNCLLRESANPFVRDKDGATLMHYAVRRASSQMIKILLLYNVDMNAQDNDGWTPLHLAVQSRRTDIVRLLLIKGADKTLKNQDGLTPLDLCLYSGRDTRTYELIRLLKRLPRGQLE